MINHTAETAGNLATIVNDTLTGYGNGSADLLDVIGSVRLIELAAEQFRRAVVHEARDNGHTWQDIGDALGTTRQAAQQRYSVARVVMEADKYV